LEQAQALADHFKDMPITAIYSSDAYRCRVTAEPLAKIKNLKVQYRMLLREYTIGTWEGYSIGYTANRFPDLYERWLTAPYDHNIPGADPFWLAADRGYEGIRQIAAENPGGVVVAISHSCTLNCAMTKVLGQPISYYTSVKSGDNTAVTKLEVDEDGNVEVIYFNDDSHLPPELLRQNYTGRGPETNFDFEYISFPQDDERYAAAVAQACEQLPDWNDAADIRARVDESLAQNTNYAFFPVLMDRVCGVVTVKKDASLPADHDQRAEHAEIHDGSRYLR
jgi:broad specificity phosphatase PhoE